MAKTTIDGLKMREPSSDERNAKAVRSSAHTIDMMKPAKSSTNDRSLQQRQKALNSIDTIRKRNAAASSFLDPVETFDFDAEPSTEMDEAGDFGATTEMDWSDLLDTIDQPAEKPNRQTARKAKKADDFLEAWGESDEQQDSLLSDNATTGADLADLTALTKDEEEELEPKPQKRREKKPHKRHIGRMVAIAVVCLLVIGGGIMYKWGDDLIARLTGGRSGLWDAINSLVSDEVPFETDKNGRTNVLIFGTEGYNMSGDTAYGAHDGAQLTDSIMVASFDQKTKDVALLSLPRDLKVSRACSAGKINEVFWCHNQDGQHEAAGAQALMDQVGDVLGIDFQYYAHINWASLIDIIDTLGGITVTLDENIADYGWTNAVATAEVPMEVNGEQALGLARARHGTTGGDFTRGNTQQKIVQGIVDKILHNGIGMTEAFNLVNILGDNLRSNFSTDNIKAGVRLVSGFDIANIRQVPLVDYNTQTFYMTTATINDISYVVPSAGERDYSEIREYVAEMFSSNPMAREHARIVVYNASGQYGVAGAERDKLVADGYKVAGVGDAELGICTEKYCIYVVGQDFPATRKALEERYGVSVKSAEELPEGIQPGEVDFAIVLGLSGESA